MSEEVTHLCLELDVDLWDNFEGTIPYLLQSLKSSQGIVGEGLFENIVFQNGHIFSLRTEADENLWKQVDERFGSFTRMEIILNCDADAYALSQVKRISLEDTFGSFSDEC